MRPRKSNNGIVLSVKSTLRNISLHSCSLKCYSVVREYCIFFWKWVSSSPIFTYDFIQYERTDHVLSGYLLECCRIFVFPILKSSLLHFWKVSDFEADHWYQFQFLTANRNPFRIENLNTIFEWYWVPKRPWNVEMFAPSSGAFEPVISCLRGGPARPNVHRGVPLFARSKIP